MKLSEWLETQNLSDAEFGRRIGKTHSTVLRLKRGEIRPSMDTVEVIRSETNGAVTGDDFLPPFTPRPSGPDATPPQSAAA